VERIVLIGGGGHCRVIIDILNSMKKYEIVGVTDKGGAEKKILDIPVIGDDSILESLYDSGVKNAFVCIGALNNIDIRDKIYFKLKNIGFNIPKLIHNKAIVSPYAEIKDGTCVMAGAVVNPGSVIGENCIINTSSVIEHDCIIGRNTHISPRSSIAGGVKIGDNCHIGMGSSVIQGITIGNNTIIGAGSVILNDIESNVTVVGVPGEIIKRR
jgi:sugar O-acyltransferase (sialic acid O-acetyltransferase NeuD family)